MKYLDRRTKSLVVLFALTFAVAACGRAGDPVRPSAVAVEGEEPAPQEAAPVDRPFILDSLLN